MSRQAQKQIQARCRERAYTGTHRCLQNGIVISANVRRPSDQETAVRGGRKIEETDAGTGVGKSDATLVLTKVIEVSEELELGNP